MSHWFYRDWWRYLFAPRSFYAPSWAAVVWCRLRGHPAGEIYYNPGGWEPDHHCKCCNDNLG